MKKKFASTEFDYSTDAKTDFKRHCVTHTGVKAHKCDTCANCFTQKSSLIKHIKSNHTKESKYECEVCEKVFTRRGNLLEHVKVVHKKIKSYFFVLNVIKLLLKIVISQDT